MISWRELTFYVLIVNNHHMRPLKPRDTEFGAHLSSLRQQQGLTIPRLATMAGVSASYVSQLETGRKPPTMKVVSQLSGALDVHPNQLLVKSGRLTLQLEPVSRPAAQVETVPMEVTAVEREQISLFLQFLRFKESIGAP